ncbi:glycosyltransferase [Flavobacterium sp.]|uniref:glycosyltransferase family 2 protein n=1 Tax=Flavobacterium sp. TaxID=239 RepID=UPI002609A2CA|nr:glycosyltransferase [Flavobacterium sp.]
MRFSLIICTYQRPESLCRLLESVREQRRYPNEILIIDGSLDDATQNRLKDEFPNCNYYLVPKEHRGLTRQRNFGISKVSSEIDVVCFLDDDTILEEDYFEQLLNTYQRYPEAVGAGGYITNESLCEFVGADYIPSINEFYYDGWKRQDGSRFVLRKRLGLDSDVPPGFLPEFSHGRSVGFLPPSGKIYEVEQLMGGVSSFRKSVFSENKFSTYFEGYGLYEDADFTLRVSKKGKLFVNTNARLTHHHAPSGRPNQYKYGLMVVRNGWYVWRVRHPKPSFKSVVKWNVITLLLTAIRYANAITLPNKQQSLTEAFGRTVGWFSLIFSKPGIK